MAELSKQLAASEEKQGKVVGALKEGWAAELKRQREGWAAGERAQRDKWLQAKTQVRVCLGPGQHAWGGAVCHITCSPARVVAVVQCHLSLIALVVTT